MRAGLEEIRVTTKGVLGAVTELVTQVSVSRSFERRLDKLETAVFGLKTSRDVPKGAKVLGGALSQRTNRANHP